MNPAVPDPQYAQLLVHLGAAWLTLAAAIAIHVLDEALTDFLAVYNPTVRRIRERLPWLPLPTFTFRVWITGLALGIALMVAVSPLAFRGARWTEVAALPLALIMIGNGLGHMGASLLRRRLMPGVLSSPLLIAAAIWALVAAWRLL